MRIQTKIKGQRRKSVSASLSRRIDKALRREAARFNVSISFVTAVIICEQLGLDLDENYK